MNDNQPATVSPEERALQELVLDQNLERLEDLLADFNLFDVLGIATRETQHSAFLGWLLDPRGSHGLRDYFLRKFLSESAKEARERGIGEFTPLDVDGWKLTDVEVATERHNIDILLIGRTDELVCLIENKIWAGEGQGQLSRYLRRVKEEYEGLNPFPIFLTPEGRDPEDDTDTENWAPIGYEVVANLIERTLDTRVSTISENVASFLKQYVGTLRRHVLNTNGNIDELALQIYNNHRGAIDLIINARSSLPDKGWAVIDTAIEQYAPSLSADFSNNSYHRFYATELETIPELRQGQGWTESSRILLFEVRYHQRSFVLLVGPGPEVTRERLYNLAQVGLPGVAMRHSQKLNRKWHAVYSKSFFKKQGSSPPDYEKAKSQVEQVIKDFYDNDYWPIVNAIRGEFDLPPAIPPAS